MRLVGSCTEYRPVSSKVKQEREGIVIGWRKNSSTPINLITRHTRNCEFLQINIKLQHLDTTAGFVRSRHVVPSCCLTLPC